MMNTRTSPVPLLSVSPLMMILLASAEPSMVTFWLSVSVDARRILLPESPASNVIVSPKPASKIACLSEPTPLSLAFITTIVIKKKEFTKGKGCYPRESSPKPTQKETSPYENNLFAKNRQPVARTSTASLRGWEYERSSTYQRIADGI